MFLEQVSNSVCGHLFPASISASKKLNLECKWHVCGALWASGRNLRSWRSTICCRKYLTVCEALCLSVGLALNCFLWDQTQAPLLSVEKHLLDEVVTLRLICSHDWLTAFLVLPSSPPVYLSLLLRQTLALHSAQIKLLLQAYLIFNRYIPVCFTVVCLRPSSEEWVLEAEHIRDIRLNPGPLPYLFLLHHTFFQYTIYPLSTRYKVETTKNRATECKHDCYFNERN